jgi:SnoaL-like domain
MTAIPGVITRFFSAWSERDPLLAVAEVTDDVTITDPFGPNSGAKALADHLEVVLRQFDFAPPIISNCFVDGDLADDARISFVVECPMTGRSSRIRGLKTGFEGAVFVNLKEGRIHRWQEYWDPAPLTKALSGR